MEQWEYLPTYIHAEATGDEIKSFVQGYVAGQQRVPRYMAEAMIPQMNQLGQQGWELVHMEPVAGLGSKGDVLFERSSVTWSNIYFCVFKRRKAGPQRSPGDVLPRTPPMPPGGDLPG